MLCALAERTFVETFGHLYPPQDLADYLATAYPVELQRQQLQSGDYAAWLLEADGEAIGFAFAGPCGLPHADAAAGDGELKRLYVLRQHQGGGQGGAAVRGGPAVAADPGAYIVDWRVVGELRRATFLCAAWLRARRCL